MTETTQADPAAASNGTAPAPDVPCEDCVTGGEKALAVLAALFGVFLVVMAVDMFTGGRVTGLIAEQVSGE